MSLTEDQKTIIKNSIPVLESSGVDLTYGFYSHMFNTHPEVLPYFNQAHHESLRQPKILAHALLQYAKNIDDLTPLTSFVHHVVVKHVGLQIKAEHYQVVGECLLYQLHKMLGDEVATAEFMKAWELAYFQLANILINAEAAKYDEQASSPNSWRDFKDFKILDIVDESDNVKSIYFAPLDGSKPATPKPGQYICIRFPPNKISKISTQREFTLSEFFDENKYRISVRKDPNGVISSFIHDGGLNIGDIIGCSPPNGELLYEEGPADSEMVLIAGGIGITPMVSITEYALSQNRKVKLLFSNKTINSMPFKNWLNSLQLQYGKNFQIIKFITEEDGNDTEFIYRRMNKTDFEFLKGDESIYLVGPFRFMNEINEILKEKNIKNIYSEEFGPITV
ncbi:hypothetical protein PACTADRAFT_31474 [Pachysolen tannophilus NRRL Y-2460]|uniref:nitric oxide dioxygenase n=1 Tax=Pachysolen tannophilus NRRL Y-2460 TaxID=669874 RepID=A0A1E4U252_PACTA|nr:hypothetical protein PACTADRAFT_31474 [Pachysolen tannophilus NRRL Y-2460]